jgi:hypothetical protein
MLTQDPLSHHGKFSSFDCFVQNSVLKNQPQPLMYIKRPGDVDTGCVKHTHYKQASHALPFFEPFSKFMV